MIRPTASPRLSYSTDPVAAGVQRALTTATFVHADRSNETPAVAAGGRLDLGWLYPTLAEPAVSSGIASRIASIAAAFASFVRYGASRSRSQPAPARR